MHPTDLRQDYSRGFHSRASCDCPAASPAGMYSGQTGISTEHIYRFASNSWLMVLRLSFAASPACCTSSNRHRAQQRLFNTLQ
jgi:hypothetical protein